MYIANVHVWSVKCRTSVIMIQIKNFRTQEIFWCFRETIYTNTRALLTLLTKITVTTKVTINKQSSISWSNTMHMPIQTSYIVICFWSVVLSSLMTVRWPPMKHVGIQLGCICMCTVLDQLAHSNLIDMYGTDNTVKVNIHFLHGKYLSFFYFNHMCTDFN